MTSCLMVMNARDIPECRLAIDALRIDKVRFRGFTESQLEAEIERFVQSTRYDRYILLSDDTIPTQQALDNVLKFENRGPVVTGWCNIFPGGNLAALELRPIFDPHRDFYLRTRDEMPPAIARRIKALYRTRLGRKAIDPFIYRHFPKLDEIWDQPEVFETFFVGWALTSMERNVWLRYGFKYSNTDRAGHGSDQNFSMRAAMDGLNMLCARDSFVYHIHSVRNFIVGKVKPEVVFEGDERMKVIEEYAADYIR